MNGPLDEILENYRVEFVWLGLAARDIGARLATRRPRSVVVHPAGAKLEPVLMDFGWNAVIAACAEETTPEQIADECMRLHAHGRTVSSIWMLGEGADELADRLAACLSTVVAGDGYGVLTLTDEALCTQVDVDETIWIASLGMCMSALTAWSWVPYERERLRARLIKTRQPDELVPMMRPDEYMLAVRWPRGGAKLSQIRAVLLALPETSRGAFSAFQEGDENAPWLDECWYAVAFAPVPVSPPVVP